MMGPTARLIEEKKPAEGQSDPATSDHLLVTAPPSSDLGINAVNAEK